MRTIIVIVIGIALAAAFVFGANFLDKSKMTGFYVFALAWLVFCAVDFYWGVNSGYGWREELGIHALLFAVPAIVAFLAAKYF